MNSEKGKQVLEALYDRLFDAITHQPANAPNPVDKASTRVHFTKNEALDASSFQNMKSPLNPSGLLGPVEVFSNMVDKIPAADLEWSPGGSLSQTYERILAGAKSSTSPSPEQLEAYERANKFLYSIVENPNTGEQDIEKSLFYSQFTERRKKLTDAIIAFRIAFNTFAIAFGNAETDKEKSQLEGQWQVDSLSLSNAIDTAHNDLLQGNGKFVQQALDITATSINDGIKSLISDAQKFVSQKLESQFPGGASYLSSYASPLNWADPENDSFSDISINSAHSNEHSEVKVTKFRVGGSANLGLTSIGGSGGKEGVSQTRDFDVEDISISAKIAEVTIVRPWFNDLLFKANNWYTNLGGNDETNYISNGDLNDTDNGKFIPRYPIGFIVAKDIKISGAFSKEDEAHIQEQLMVGGTVSIGPFQIGGNYRHGKKEDKVQSSYDKGTLTVGGMQIIAWVSKVIPASPRLSHNQGEAAAKNNETQAIPDGPLQTPVEVVTPFDENLYNNRKIQRSTSQQDNRQKDISIEITVNLNGREYSGN